MFISKITLLLFSLLAFIAPALTYPVEGDTEADLWNSPEALAALAIINDPTPKFLMNITFMDEETHQNVTAQTSYICDTTSGSPSVHWVREVSGELRGKYRNSVCMQRNPFGSKCTTLHSLGDAAISLCGVLFRWYFCDAAGFAGFWISDHCAWNGLAGGRFIYDDIPESRVAVHKS
ncbi:hypothetical protein C7212DRAFT_315070 [Tuber magnatum]|uniref:AA1-like domain-containing protein n=1 Tax=Tuber magnatum TaxID=42249 RepID=A0A317STN7_9PEZI|nr:hypothetical protein C7212DRAFT_315070 [Tuber magnatum]